MNRFFWGMCLLLLGQPALFSQTIRFYSSDGELSSSLINHIYQDRRGFIWVATQDGLNFMDGRSISVYRRIQNDSTSLKNNYVKTLFEDSSGNFWVGCINGLQLYHRNTDTFQEIFLYKDDGTRAFPHVTSIIERSNGEIWLSTSGSGVITFRKGSMHYSNETALNGHLCSHFLTMLFEDSKGRIWIGSENNGLSCYQPENGRLLQFPGLESQIGNLTVFTFCEDADRTIFIGTSAGLYTLDETGVLYHVPYSQQARNYPVRSLLIRSDGKILAGTDGNGFKIYNPATRRLDDYELTSTPFDFSKTNILTMLEDNSRNVWAGVLQKGVLFIPVNSNNFRYYGYRSFDNNLIGSNCVTSVCKIRDGRLLVGTDNDGLYMIDRHRQTARHYSSADRFGSVPGTVVRIFEARDGTVWLGSYINGLSRFDVNTGKCTFYPNQTGNHPANDKIYAIVETADGKLWIGTYGNGFFRFDPRSGKYEAHYFQQTDEPTENQLSNNWINDMTCDHQGRLWIGTYKGVSCFDPHTETFLNYYEDPDGLPSNVVSSVEMMSAGIVWLGTDGGLVCLNYDTGQIKTFTTDDGLSNNTICGIACDTRNNIWVSTYSGISKYCNESNIFENYFASDGLQGNEFKKGAKFRANDGEIFFGGPNGITSFYPHEIQLGERDLQVYITALYLFDQKVAVGQKSGNKTIIDRLMLDAAHINLRSNDNMFSFEFSTLEYGQSAATRFRYRMENFDDTWLTTSEGTRRVTFTNLNAGTYHFSVQACIHNNCSPVKTVVITIRPHWYLSAWAKAVYFLMAMLLLYGIYSFFHARIRHRQEMMLQKHAEQINEAKLQFFINISHEIRTPMTLVIGPLKKLIAAVNPPELQKTYLLMYRNAHRILRLINQLMDIRKIDRGQMFLKCRETDMVGFIIDIMQAFNYMAEQKHIRFTFIHEMPELKVWVDLNNFDKVLFNILSNAFKFTPDEGSIHVSLATGKDQSQPDALKYYFEIQVRDTGIGIDESKIERIFERFYQTSNGQQNGFGTGIGLHLALSLVQLLHGTLTARNNADGTGSAFIVRLPMGNKHLTADELEETPANRLQTIVHNDDLVGQIYDDQPPQKKDPRTKYRIVVIDDEADIRNYIRTELFEIYHVLVAPNGKEGLSLTLKEKPDLVISDIIMDGMDGMSLCRKIKTNVNTAHIPVILLTAKSQDEDKVAGLNVGADAYITKPFNPDMLKRTVANLLENRERLKDKFADVSEGKMEKITLKTADELLMERVMKAVNKHLDNPELNVDMLSRDVGISRVHMHRKLKELTNQSPRDFIRTVRLKQAANLLFERKLSISEVAYAVGFSSLSHFSSCFRNFHGMTPKEFADRKKNHQPLTINHFPHAFIPNFKQYHRLVLFRSCLLRLSVDRRTDCEFLGLRRIYCRRRQTTGGASAGSAHVPADGAFVCYDGAFA